MKTLFATLLLVYTSIGIGNAQSTDDKGPHRFMIKVSPSALLLARTVVGLEFQTTPNQSIELYGIADYLASTDLIYGNRREFGNYRVAGIRYKYFPSFENSFIALISKGKMDGAYLAGGLLAGSTPLLANEGETVFKYYQNTFDQRSTLISPTFDLGYALTIQRFVFEAFVGCSAEYFTKSASRTYIDDLDEWEYTYNSRVLPNFRFGLRMGIMLF